jgi:hypothetical protein
MLQSEKLEDNKDYVIEIIKDKRTSKQNKYLWVIFELIAEFYNNGNENETAEFYSKEKAKARILYEIGHCDYYISKEDGTKFGIIKSTSKLSKAEFSELTENIINVMSVKGLIIFDPETYFSKLNY